MAEVTGDLGGQPIQLNNAATEATLKEILVAILKQGLTGKGGKAQKELEQKIKDLAKETESLTDEQKDAIKKQKEINKKKEEEIKQAAELGKAMNGLISSVTSVITGMTNMISTMSRLDNSMTAAAQSMSAIPVVGGALATVFGAVAGAADRTYKAFQQAASVGANFGGSITDMVNAAAGAGLTFDQFSGIVSRTGADLALLGGSTSEGAKRLAMLGKEIRNTTLGDDLARLGYSTEQINESMAKYSGVMAKTGALQGMNNAQLASQTGEYLKNLDAVSKLTGLNKKDLEDQRAQMMRDAQLRNTLRKMDAASQEELMSFLQTLPPELQEGAKEVIATGTATSEAGRAALQYLPDSGRAFMQMNAQIKQTGTFTKENNRALNASIQSEAKRVANSPLAENMRLYGDKYAQGVFTAIDDVAARQKDLGTIQDQTAKEAEERRKKAKADLDAANLKKFQEQIAEVSNTFTAFLANSGLLQSLQTAFTNLVGFVETFVVPAFKFVSDNALAIGLVMAPLIATVAAVNTVLAINNFLENARKVANLGAIKSLGKLAFAGLAASGPFVILGAIGMALYMAFNKLYESGWSFSDAFEAIGDNIKRFYIGYVDIWLSIAEKIAKFFGGGDKIKAMREGLDLQRKELDEKEKARDQRRKETAEKRKLEEEQNKLTKDGIDIKKQENDANKPAATGPSNAYDLSTPQKMYESAMRRQQGAAAQPGAGAAAPPATSGAVQDQIKAQLAAKGITDPKAVANIMAQVQAESGFKPQSENLNYSGKKLFEMYGAGNKGGNKVRFNTLAEAEALAAKGPEAVGNMIYGGRMGNAGDEGFKYRGRGLIQLTGKDNYAKYGKLIGVDLVKNPDLANDPQIASQIAAAYFAEKQKAGVNLGDIAAVGKAVGYAGGAQETAKRAQMAQAFMPGGAAATPSSGAAASAVAQAPATTTTPATTPTQTAQVPAATQESPAALLSSLNSKMDVLIALNRRANDTRDRQLSAAKTTAGEVTAYAAA